MPVKTVSTPRADRPMRTLRLRRLGLALVAIAALVIGALQTVPEFILFRERLVLNLLEIESDIDLKPVDIATSDGLALRSWYHPPQPGKPVIVYFPGRLGDILKKPSHLFELAEEGYGLMLAGYRGYGGNPGRPSERHLYNDAASLLGKVLDNHLAPDGIVLYGYSMGTGIATHAANQVRARGVILEAPFTSFPEVVRRQASPVPLWLVRSRFDSRSRMQGIEAPVLLLAGQNDWITPPDFAEVLSTLSAGAAALHVFPEANHVNMIRHGAGEAIASFLLHLE